MDDEAVIQLACKCDPHIIEVWRARYYKGSREAKDGGHHPITIEILAGRTAMHLVWYLVTATDEETGLVAHGNGGKDLATAFEVLHWAELDKEPPPDHKFPPGSVGAKRHTSKKGKGR